MTLSTLLNFQTHAEAFYIFRWEEAKAIKAPNILFFCFRHSVRPSWTAAAAAVRNVSPPQLRAHQAPPRSNWRPPMRRPSSSTRLKTLQPSCQSPARATGPSSATGSSFLSSVFSPFQSFSIISSFLSFLVLHPPCFQIPFSPHVYCLRSSFLLLHPVYNSGPCVTPPASSLQEP